MEKINIGVIGLGVGEKHIEAYEKHPQCNVIKMCDFSNEKLKEVSQRHPGIEAVHDASLILNDPNIQVVSIASYDNFHFEQIMQAIDQQKNVFVEKPLCLNDRQLKKLWDQCKSDKVKISSNLILRMSPRFKWLKNKIKAGAMGDIFYLEGDYDYGRFFKIKDGWRGQIDDYSVVLGGGIHIIDLLTWILQDDIVEVAAFGNRIVSHETQFRYDDTAVSILKFKSGVIGKMSTKYACVHKHFHHLSIYGSEATFINGTEEAFWHSSTDKNYVPEKIDEAYPGTHKGDLIESFVSEILGTGKAIVQKDEVFKIAAVCLAIDQAKKEEKTIKVDYSFMKK